MARSFKAAGSGVDLGVTILIAACANSALAAARLLLPIVALGMGATGFFVGIMSALFAAAPMIFSVRFGRWVDRSGTRRPMLLATALIFGAGIPYLVWPRAPMLIPMAALVGTGAIFAHVAALRAVTASLPASARSTNLGYLVFSYSLFQFIGPVIASLCYERAGPAGAIASICGLALLALALTGPSWHRFRDLPAAPSGDIAQGGLAALVAIRSLRMWILISSIFSTAQVIFPFVLSLYSVDVGLPAPQAGIALGAFALGTAVSRLCTGVVSRHLEPRSIAIGSLLASAGAYSLLPFIDGLHFLLPLCAALGMSLGMGVPVALVPIYDEAPEGRLNEALGLSMTLNAFLQTATPLIFGLTATALGIGAMIWLIGLVLLAAAIVGAVALDAREG